MSRPPRPCQRKGHKLGLFLKLQYSLRHVALRLLKGLPDELAVLLAGLLLDELHVLVAYLRGRLVDLADPPAYLEGPHALPFHERHLGLVYDDVLAFALYDNSSAVYARALYAEPVQHSFQLPGIHVWKHNRTG